MALNPGAAKLSFGFKKAEQASSTSQSGSNAGPSKPFGFKLAGAVNTKGKEPSLPRKPAFSALQDDDDQESESGGGSAASKGKAKDKTAGLLPFGTAAAPASRVEKKTKEAALQEDPSIFDYDAAYDLMQQAKRVVQERKDVEKEDRKVGILTAFMSTLRCPNAALLPQPKYISSILESAEVRKRDHARAEAKSIQREREREGDEFEGTEAFVTDAYREQLEEIKRLEAKEAKEEEELRKKAAAGRGAGFMKELLKAQDQDHTAIMAAASLAKLDKGKEPESSEETPRKKSDLELARDARARGLKVELNDEGELVDNLDILSKGLNVIRQEKHNSQGPGSSSRTRDTSSSAHGFDQRASGDARRAQRMRQTKLIEEQMLEQERKRAEEEARELEERKKRLTGLATEEDVKKREEKLMGAKERALERKRKREEELKKAAAGGDGQPPS